MGRTGRPGEFAADRTRIETPQEANPENVAAVVAAAKGGEMAAAKLILDRAWPIPRGRTVALPLPRVEDAGGLVAAMAAPMRLIAAGLIVSGLVTMKLAEDA